ncbi:hypothetical protein BKN14_03435 [Candidatus Gracilibacteria bacterium HOT-871]|nr:hypothetical protein BKN14_03435 [Candidatus Gracilibacteria bacterium HOT-871]
MNITIRNMQEKDLLSCSIILKNEYGKEPYFEIFENNNHLNYIESKFLNNKKTSFVVLDNDTIIGFCISSLSFWVDGLQGIIEEIVIDGAYRGKGVGKKIYFYVEDFLRNLGVKSLMLWAQNDSIAFNFHIKNGFFKSNNHSIMFKNL